MGHETPRHPRLNAQGALTLVSILCALAWSTFLILPHLRGEATLLDRIEAPLTDLRFLLAGPRTAPEDVVLVAIDDESVRAAGGYPVSRAYLARLLRRLAEAKPKAVAVDILFLDPGNEADDSELAAALKAMPSAIGLAAIFGRNGQEATASFGPFANLPVAGTVQQPIERLRTASQAGTVNVATDHGGTPRHIPLLIATEGAALPALALQTAMLAAGKADLSRDYIVLGGTSVPVDLGAHLAIRYLGPQGSVRTLSAKAVIEGAIPTSEISDRVVVLGVTALGSGDTLSTPFDPVLPGAELLATGVGQLLHGDPLMRTTAIRRLDAGIAVLTPVLVLLLLAFRRVAVGLALAALLLTLLLAATCLAFTHDLWLSLSLPLAAVAVPLGPYLGARLWLDRRRQGQLEVSRNALLRFHPPALAAKLEADPDFLERPVEQRAAILFVDLSGFTGLSERLGPVRTRALLKEMHELVEDIATTRGGSVTSFMGDGAMVVFGLPEAVADDADRAADAALVLARSLQSWIAEQASASGDRPAGLRIGVHAGRLVMSRLGGRRNQQITATGDTVNVASRLLEIAKAERASVVLTQPLLDAMVSQLASIADFERKSVPVRGRAEPLAICILRAVPQSAQ